MRFQSERHKREYERCIARCGYPDCYREALIYALTLDRTICDHIDQVYDFASGCVKAECLHAGWQTGGSTRITRLAFNLYNGGEPSAFDMEDPEEARKETHLYSPSEIFTYDNELNEYLFEAIRIRFR